MRELIFILVSVILVVPCFAKTITVDDDGPADFSTIQAAINDANDGDEIIVSIDTYYENIDFDGKNIILLSTEPMNPIVAANTIIDGRLGGSVVTFSGTESPTCLLSGLTITNGKGTGVGMNYGGGIYGNGTEATIQYNIILGNRTASPYWPCSGFGGGLYDCDGTIQCNIISDNETYCDEGGAEGGGLFGCDGTIQNNVISNNSASGFSGGWGSIEGGGLSHCDATIQNNTIFGNSAHSGGGLSNCNGTITNCIIWQNAAEQGAQIYASSTPSYSCIQDWLGGSTSNINADPCFADPGNDDYHLQSQAGRWYPNTQSWVTDANTSHCIDAGNPGCPLGEEPNDVNNVRINMGGYGGTAEASKSPTNWRNIADLTNDWTVDFNDLDVFTNYWLDDGDCIPSDLNRSQAVDFADFAIFAENWLDALPILTDADIIAELEYLETINTYPENLNIDPNDYPIILGRYSENWLVLIEKYFCSDVCPQYGRVVLIYEDITSEEKCAEIGGVDIIDPAWGSYIGCAPDVE